METEGRGRNLAAKQTKRHAVDGPSLQGHRVPAQSLYQFSVFALTSLLIWYSARKVGGDETPPHAGDVERTVATLLLLLDCSLNRTFTDASVFPVSLAVLAGRPHIHRCFFCLFVCFLITIFTLRLMHFKLWRHLMFLSLSQFSPFLTMTRGTWQRGVCMVIEKDEAEKHCTCIY